MSSSSIPLLAFIAVIAICAAAYASAGRQNGSWNYYHFDGSGFVAGQPADGTPFLAVRDHVLPVVMSLPVKVEAVALPEGTGALAGICYIQSVGGKMAEVRSHLPCPGAALEIHSRSTLVLRVTTDDSGYFVALLPPGSYRVSSGAFAAEVTVERGTTTLVPLRAGKRMVD